MHRRNMSNHRRNRALQQKVAGDRGFSLFHALDIVRCLKRRRSREDSLAL
jgi:hypothetical protein